MDIFTGEAESKEDILRQHLESYRNATREQRERQEAEAAAARQAARSGAESEIENADEGGERGVEIGDFGPVLTQFKGDARGAVKKLIELQSGEAVGALHHKDIGDIDLVWGQAGTAKSDGFGLAKLVKFHPEVVGRLQEILDEMHITTRSENRINLESSTHKAAVRLTWNSKKKKWLLTAFEKKETSEPIDKTTDTDDNRLDLQGDTALSQNSDVSTGKVTNYATEKQETGSESLGKTQSEKVRNTAARLVADFPDAVDSSLAARLAKNEKISPEEAEAAIAEARGSNEAPLMSVGEEVGGNADAYNVAKGMLESSGIAVHEVGGEEAAAMMEQRGEDTRLMGSKTDRKMERIAEHYADKELDSNQRAVVDVFSGKADNVVIEVERPEGTQRVVMRQGREPKAGTKHSLFRHFDTTSNYITAEDIAMIPEVIAKGERNVDGKRVSYDYVTEDGTRLRVTTETGNRQERFTNYISNRKPQSSELVENTQLSAQASDAEVSGAKVGNNGQTAKEIEGQKGEKLLKSPSGTVYGWVANGEVWLNRDAMNPETPLHEYTHLWDDMVRRENPELWERGKELLRQMPLWDEVVNDPNYADIAGDEDAVASEVHSRLVGRDGARLLEDMISKAKEEGEENAAKAANLVERIKGWLQEMFASLKKTLEKWSGQELADLTAEDFAKLTIRDLAEGMNPKSGDKNLVAIHNVSEAKLLQSLELGGFSMPSIAITRADIGHSGYGGISLIFGKESINPAKRNNKVYSGDAWTPTFPTIGYKLNPKRTSDIYTRANRAHGLPMFNASSFHAVNYEGRIKDSDNSLVDAFMDSYDAKQLYLFEKGHAVQNYIKHQVAKYTERAVRLYEDMLQQIGEERLLNEKEEDLRPEVETLIAKYQDISEVHPQLLSRKIVRSILGALDYARNGNLKTETDADATRAEIDRRIDLEDYRRWLEELFSGIVEKKGIRNGRDMYTPSGNMRKWESLYDSLTLDNVLKVMQKQEPKGGQGIFGGSIFGSSTTEFGSVQEMRQEAARRIKSIPEEAYKAERERILDRLSKLSAPKESASIADHLDFVDNVKDAVAKSHTASGIYKFLRGIYPGMTMDIANEIADIVKDIQQMSTRYFEAKPRRIVGFEEIKLAVVPEGTSKEFVDKLEKLGVSVRTYQQGNEQQRQKIVSQATADLNLRFHVASERGGEYQSAMDEGMIGEPEVEYNDDADILTRPVTDPATLDRLNSEPTVKVYRAMQLIDGGLRPPMSAKVDGELREATEIGVWEEAEERPELADAKGKFKLNKGNGSSINAAYNPYIHTSRSPINDQFSSAWSRPELVTVEVEVPESELTSGYKADKAKDSVGEKEWKSGPVGRALAKIGHARRVILSRWGKVTRIVPVDEVAEEYAQRLNKHDIAVPFNTVPPALREALVKHGVKISEPEKGNAGESSRAAYEEWLEMYDMYSAMSRGREDFDSLRERAIAERGIVMPGLNEAEVRVVEVPRHDFAGTGKEALRAAEAWAKDNIVGKHTATDSKGSAFEYSISNDAVEKYVSRSATDKSDNIGVHLAALKKLPEIISESIEAEVHADYNKGKDGKRHVENGYNPSKLVHRFYGAVSIDGITYRVKSTIEEFKNNGFPNAAHSYEVTEIEAFIEETTNTSTDGALTSTSSREGILGTAKLLQGVEKSYDSGKKLLDESKKSDESLRQASQNSETNSVEEKPSAMEARVRELAGVMHLDNVEIVRDASTLSGKRAKAKGFFNWRTGKITIVLPNNADVADVVQTLLHEAVAHYGLRKLFGKDFEAFLDKVFESAAPEVRGRIAQMSRQHDWDYLTATEEYLAALAEDTDFEKGFAAQGWWMRVKELFRAMLASLGMGEAAQIGDKELRYTLWRSYQNLAHPQWESGPLGMAEAATAESNFDQKHQESEEEADYYRSMQSYNESVQGLDNQVKEAHHDGLRSLLALQDEVCGWAKVKDNENVYLHMMHKTSVDRVEQEDMERRILKPLEKVCDQLRKKGLNGRMIDDYLICLHGEERNAYIGNKRQSRQDYSGLTGLFDPDGKLGLTVDQLEEKARKYVARIEGMAPAETKELCKLVEETSHWQLDKMMESGYISRETRDQLANRYRHYVPLEGYDESLAEDLWDYAGNERVLNGPMIYRRK